MKKKLKIGIFLNKDEKLYDGHIKIISDFIKSDYIKLEYIFEYENQKKLNFLSYFLYSFISKVEKKYCLIIRKKEEKIVKNFMSNIKKYSLNDSNRDKFFKDKLVKKNLQNIDLLLFFEKSRFVKSKITSLPKLGSWLIDFGVEDFIFTGFWESLYKKNVTKVGIQKINSIYSKKKFLVIDQGFYSTKIASWFSNRDFVLEKSSVLLKKNIRLLYLKLKNKKQKQKFYKNKIKPGSIILLKYIFKKYTNAFFRKSLLSLFYPNNIKSYTEPNHNRWNIHVGNKLNNKLSSFKTSKRIEPPKNQAWADPFLISYKKEDYLFFENYEFSKKKAKISFIKISNKNILEVDDALDMKFHLSYPFLWKEKNNIFMMPESGKKNVYKYGKL